MRTCDQTISVFEGQQKLNINYLSTMDINPKNNPEAVPHLSFEAQHYARVIRCMRQPRQHSNLGHNPPLYRWLSDTCITAIKQINRTAEIDYARYLHILLGEIFECYHPISFACHCINVFIAHSIKYLPENVHGSVS
jgi:hypothetical protein